MTRTVFARHALFTGRHRAVADFRRWLRAEVEVFAERGGESVTTDASGRVYVAIGQIFVYARDGKEL